MIRNSKMSSDARITRDGAVSSGVVFFLFLSIISSFAAASISSPAPSNAAPLVGVDDSASVDTAPSKERLFSPWTHWSRCSARCVQRRRRDCLMPSACGENVVVEKRACPNTCRSRRARHQTFIKRLLTDLSNTRRENPDADMEDLVFSNWSQWSRCSRSCRQRRVKECQFQLLCERRRIQEERECFPEGTRCGERKRNSGSYETKIIYGEEEEIEEEKKKDTPEDAEKSSKGSNSTFLDFGDFECGTKPSFNPRRLRIIGGKVSRRGSWPWQVSVMNRWREISCGGTLIHPQWVVTAAHCVRRKKLRPRNILIRVGDHDNTLYERSEFEVRVEAKFQHPDFDLETVDSDVALLKLERPVRATPFAQPACLPPAGEDLPPGTECFVTGWGKLHASAYTGAEILHQARVPLIDQRVCRRAFEYEITDNMLCAGYKSGHIDSCDGDSGGPLVCKTGGEKNKRSTGKSEEEDEERRRNRRRRKPKRMSRNRSREERRKSQAGSQGGGTKDSSGWTLYGVTSFGDGCGVRGKFGVYARVSNFVEWIRKTIRENS